MMEDKCNLGKFKIVIGSTCSNQMYLAEDVYASKNMPCVDAQEEKEMDESTDSAEKDIGVWKRCNNFRDSVNRSEAGQSQYICALNRRESLWDEMPQKIWQQPCIKTYLFDVANVAGR